MKLLCTKRRVYMETAVFAKGAALCAADRLRPQTSYPYAMICEGHLKASVTMQVLHKGQDTAVTLGSCRRQLERERRHAGGDPGKAECSGARNHAV